MTEMEFWEACVIASLQGGADGQRAIENADPLCVYRAGLADRKAKLARDAADAEAIAMIARGASLVDAVKFHRNATGSSLAVSHALLKPFSDVRKAKCSE